VFVWLLRPWLVTDVEHVGSTAVPGMVAKPVIDMIASVGDLDQAQAAEGALLELDYHYRPHRPEALLFDKPVLGDWRLHTHHLHLTLPGSDLWRERLTFRDALRSDPALVAAEYSQWKLHHLLPEATADATYDESKWPFVARVLATHGVEFKADRERLTQPGTG
jgi:GrpB-like predicted nucleotidyltransferase (UPF0157 family)